MHVRFAPKADKWQIVPACPLCAKTGLVHCSKMTGSGCDDLFDHFVGKREDCWRDGQHCGYAVAQLMALTRGYLMTLVGLPAFTMIAMVWLGVQAEAQTPCREYLRLRNAANEAWKQAMSAPPLERCGALYHSSSAAEATFKYANNNRESCDISVPLLNQVERYHREAVQARDNACAGRPLRPYPADIIQR